MFPVKHDQFRSASLLSWFGLTIGSILWPSAQLRGWCVARYVQLVALLQSSTPSPTCGSGPKVVVPGPPFSE